MFTSIFNSRSVVLAVALSGFLGAGLANAQTPKTPPTNSPATKSLPQRLARTSYGHEFRGWTAYCFFKKYQCYGYYSPARRLWFYWYAPFNRFLPISYLTIYPPTNIGVAPVGPAVGDQPALPPGATPAPTQPPMDTPPLSPDLKKSGKPNPTQEAE
jgi:hypothetical protein